MANNSKHICTMEGFEAKQQSVADYVSWAYDDTMRNERSTRNFIMGIAEKLKTYEDKVSQTLLPKLNLNKQ